MSGQEVALEIAKIRGRQSVLMREHEALQVEIFGLIEKCPHDRREPYRACGVETSRCVYCGHEKHVTYY